MSQTERNDICSNNNIMKRNPFFIPLLYNNYLLSLCYTVINQNKGITTVWSQFES